MTDKQNENENAVLSDEELIKFMNDKRKGVLNSWMPMINKLYDENKLTCSEYSNLNDLFMKVYFDSYDNGYHKAVYRYDTKYLTYLINELNKKTNN